MNKFDIIYDDMLAQFPLCEIKSRETFDAILKSPQYNLKVFDFGYLFYFKSDFILIDYLAVFKPHHSRGFGSDMLKAFINSQSDCNGFIFEVEQADKANPLSLKRQNFYKKFGCTKLDFKYHFPNDEKLLEMDLFYYPAKNINPSPKELYEFIQSYFALIHNDVCCRDEVLDIIYRSNF